MQHWANAHTKRYTPDSVDTDMMSGSGSRCTIASDQCASTERDRTRAAAAAVAGMVAAAASAMAAAEVGTTTKMQILIN